MTDPLPALPSALLRHGLADLAKAEADPRYIVDMNCWHRGEPDKDLCTVDLAGAVMAFSLGAPIRADLKPHDFKSGNAKPDVRDKLLALDDLRGGAVWLALERLGLKKANCLPSGSPDDRVTICPYRQDRAQFRADLEALAARLAKDGL